MYYPIPIPNPPPPYEQPSLHIPHFLSCFLWPLRLTTCCILPPPPSHFHSSLLVHTQSRSSLFRGLVLHHQLIITLSSHFHTLSSPVVFLPLHHPSFFWSIEFRKPQCSHTHTYTHNIHTRTQSPQTTRPAFHYS